MRERYNSRRIVRDFFTTADIQFTRALNRGVMLQLRSLAYLNILKGFVKVVDGEAEVGVDDLLALGLTVHPPVAGGRPHLLAGSSDHLHVGHLRRGPNFKMGRRGVNHFNLPF